MTTYTCPVCGFNELSSPPRNWTICPSCLTEFGSSYDEWGPEEFRKEWIGSGAKWSADYWQRPQNWSPFVQLRNIGYQATPEDHKAVFAAEGYATGKIRLSGYTVLQTVQAMWARQPSSAVRPTSNQLVKNVPELSKGKLIHHYQRF